MKIEKVFPTWVWMVYVALFTLSIPWYLPANIEMNLVLGLPLWLIGCILAVFLMACFTIFIINRYWKEV